MMSRDHLATDPAGGRVLRLFLRPAHRKPVREVDEALAIAGQGLQGDHADGGWRQVTLLAEESWRAACAALGPDAVLPPLLRRANVLVAGVELGAAIGGQLRLGAVLVEVLGETRPCQLMDDSRAGLRAALKPERRGGVFGRILTGGVLRVGDVVTVTPAAR